MIKDNTAEGHLWQPILPQSAVNVSYLT